MGELRSCLFAAVYTIATLVTYPRVQAKDQACPHADMWKPTDDGLKQILEIHRQWAEEWGRYDLSIEWAAHHLQGSAQLCKADLRGAQLSGADLRGAQLNGADLTMAQLNEADLRRADLRGAQLDKADLRRADLGGAGL